MTRGAMLDLIVSKMRTYVGRIDDEKFTKDFSASQMRDVATNVLKAVPEVVELPQMTISGAGELGMVWFFGERQFDVIFYPDGDVTWTYASADWPRTQGHRRSSDDEFIPALVGSLKALNNYYVGK